MNYVQFSVQIDYDLMTMEFNRKISKCRLCHKSGEKHWEFKSYHVFVRLITIASTVFVRAHDITAMRATTAILVPQKNSFEDAKNLVPNGINAVAYCIRSETANRSWKNSTWNSKWSVRHKWPMNDYFQCTTVEKVIATREIFAYSPS